MSKQIVDRKEVRSLRNAGMTLQGIADIMRCSASTIKRILYEEGYISSHLQFEREGSKFPILPEEILQYRKKLRIGQTIRVEIQKMDDKFCLYKTEENCIVAEKYKYFCVVKDRKGHRESFLYADLMIKEREKAKNEEI